MEEPFREPAEKVPQQLLSYLIPQIKNELQNKYDRKEELQDINKSLMYESKLPPGLMAMAENMLPSDINQNQINKFTAFTREPIDESKLSNSLLSMEESMLLPSTNSQNQISKLTKMPSFMNSVNQPGKPSELYEPIQPVVQFQNSKSRLPVLTPEEKYKPLDPFFLSKIKGDNFKDSFQQLNGKNIFILEFRVLMIRLLLGPSSSSLL